LKDFNKILSESKELKDFRLFDTDQEWNRFLAATGIAETTTQGARIKSLNTEKSSEMQILYMLAFAASMILIFAAVFVLRKDAPSSATLAAGNSPEKITLSDGSAVEVASGSKLTYFTNLEHSDLREVRLDGDASFDISSSILPFRVYHKDIFIDVLGTEFSVKDSQEGILIKNFSGSVKVSEIKNPSNNVTLRKGDAFLYRDGVFTDTNKPVITEVIEEKPAPPVAKPVKKEKEVVVTPVPAKEPEKPAVTFRRFKLESVINDYLLKFNKKKLKVDKKNKPDFDKIVSIDNIDKPFLELLTDLKKQGVIDFAPGDCADCYIISAPSKNE